MCGRSGVSFFAMALVIVGPFAGSQNCCRIVRPDRQLKKNCFTLLASRYPVIFSKLNFKATMSLLHDNVAAPN